MDLLEPPPPLPTQARLLPLTLDDTDFTNFTASHVITADNNASDVTASDAALAATADAINTDVAHAAAADFSRPKPPPPPPLPPDEVDEIEN